VLNASRHHRKNRSCANVETTSAIKCSTPRGITGKIAVFLALFVFPVPRAQRLAASPEKSHFHSGVVSV